MKSGSDEFLSEINVTPFVDVMLVLLVIFIVTAPMLIQGIDVDLPRASTKALKSGQDRIIISIDNDFKVYINNQVVSIDFLAKKLKAVLENVDEKNVYLKADKKVPYGVVINIISKVKKAGINSLGMITLPEDKK